MGKQVLLIVSTDLTYASSAVVSVSFQLFAIHVYIESQLCSPHCKQAVGVVLEWGYVKQAVKVQKNINITSDHRCSWVYLPVLKGI